MNKSQRREAGKHRGRRENPTIDLDAADIWDLINRNPKVFLTEAEAAKALNQNPRWLALGRHEGYGPAHVKFGRMVRYRGSALIEYADAAEAGEAA